MRHFLFIIALLISLQNIAQDNNEEKCTENKKKAQIDFKNEKITGHYLYMDIEFDSDSNFESLYHTYMFSKYSIFLESDFYDSDKCYIIEMDRLIRSKYGSDIYTQSRRKVLNLYKNATRQEQSKIIDTSKYYIYSESQPKFIGNDYSLRNYLKKHYTYNTKNKSEDDIEFRLISLFINRQGKIVDIESTTDFMNKGSNKDQLIREVNALGDFVPAYLIDIPVNSKLHIDLW